MSFRSETLAEGVVVYLGDCLEVLPTIGPVGGVTGPVEMGEYPPGI